VIPLTRLPFARIFRTPRAWLSCVLWLGFAVAVALFEKSHAESHAADHVLPDAYGGLVLPLVVFALVGAVVVSTSLRASIFPVTAIGASGARAAIASVVVVALVSAVVCGAFGAALVPLSGAIAPIRADVIASGWVSALGAACYASFFVFGTSFGKTGTGRMIFLVIDWVLGSAGGPLEIITPRAHLRNLLGGAPLDHCSQTVSAVTLAAIAVLCMLFSARRAR
jgi:hypothetical protein